GGDQGVAKVAYLDPRNDPGGKKQSHRGHQPGRQDVDDAEPRGLRVPSRGVVVRVLPGFRGETRFFWDVLGHMAKAHKIPRPCLRRFTPIGRLGPGDVSLLWVCGAPRSAPAPAPRPVPNW